MQAPCIAIIPARYASSRFPGKPLASILEKTLLQHTYENAARCSKLHDVVVATDDERIFSHAKEFGGKAVMTSVDCMTGTDRLAEACRHLGYYGQEIIVNIQGDEPCMAQENIEAVVKVLLDDPQAMMSTGVVRLHSKEEALCSNTVKCVFDQQHNALYFSRGLLPSKKGGGYCPDTPYYKHLGIYAYRAEFIHRYAALSISPLQKSEDLEQLKVLEHGYRIKIAIVPHDSLGVDIPEDLKKIEKFLCKQNTFLSPAASVLH